MAYMEKKQLFAIINQASFAVDETRLFLDTHPDNKQALEYFDKMQAVRKQAIKQYTSMYGSISSYDVNVTNSWTWTEGPWPWETGGC